MTLSTDFSARLLCATAAIVVTIAALALAIVPGSPQTVVMIGGLA
jgi:hypothetical protein